MYPTTHPGYLNGSFLTPKPVSDNFETRFIITGSEYNDFKLGLEKNVCLWFHPSKQLG